MLYVSKTILRIYQMAITSKANKITFKAVIYEDEVVALRKKLLKLAPQELIFNLKDCDDIHTAIIQQVLAYQKLYTCSYIFGKNIKNYQKVIEGFDLG